MNYCLLVELDSHRPPKAKKPLCIHNGNLSIHWSIPNRMVLSEDEVSRHNTRSSCWVIIRGEAYDMTDFLDQHPAGPEIILKYAGRDATEEFVSLQVLVKKRLLSAWSYIC